MEGRAARRPEETWRPIPGFDGYEASNLGRVRTWKHKPAWERSVPRPHVMKLKPYKGYLRVNLATQDGTLKTFGVHTLVLMAFVGPKPDGMGARHFPDRTRSNNVIENLSWGTSYENAQDMALHNTLLKAARLGLSPQEQEERFGPSAAQWMAAMERDWPHLSTLSARARLRRQKRTQQKNATKGQAMTQSKAELLAEKQRIEDALREVRDGEIAVLRERIADLAAENGVSARAFIEQNLLNDGPAKRVVRRGVEPPKYVSPNDSTVTWSGKGPRPAWFEAALAQGFDPSDMLIGTQSRANGNGAHA